MRHPEWANAQSGEVCLGSKSDPEAYPSRADASLEVIHDQHSCAYRPVGTSNSGARARSRGWPRAGLGGTRPGSLNDVAPTAILRDLLRDQPPAWCHEPYVDDSVLNGLSPMSTADPSRRFKQVLRYG